MALWRTTQFRQGMVSFFPKLACCLHNSVHFFLQVSFFPMHLIFSPFSYFASLLHFLQLPSLLLLPILPPPFLFCPLLFFNGQHFTFFFFFFLVPRTSSSHFFTQYVSSWAHFYTFFFPSRALLDFSLIFCYFTRFPVYSLQTERDSRNEAKPNAQCKLA